MGAMTGLAFAADDPRINSFVAIVPIPNPLWGNDDPSKAIEQLPPRPVLCLYAEGGVDFSGTVCSRINGRPNAETKGYPGGHELEKMRGQIAEDALAFFRKHLQ